jgi:hypothetical protein
MAIMRAQLELSVCDVPNAGTKDPVSATLDEREASRQTWLDRPGPDFERGATYRYDLTLDQVRTLADVGGLRVSKSGNDDLCLRELRLIVNNATIYQRSFGSGFWLAQTRNSVRTTRSELRGNAAWQSYVWSLPEWIARTGGAIPQAEIVERLQGCIATAMHDLGLAWKPGTAEPVHLRRRDDNTVSGTVDLVRPIAYWADADVVVDFELTVCKDGHPVPAITRVSLRQVPTWYEAAFHRDRTAENQRMLTVLSERLTHARPLVLPDGICPHVDPSANLTYE